MSSFVGCAGELTWGSRATGLRFLHWTVGSRHGAPDPWWVRKGCFTRWTLVGTLRPLADIGGRLLEERLQNNWRRSSSEARRKKTAPVQFYHVCVCFLFSYGFHHSPTFLQHELCSYVLRKSANSSPTSRWSPQWSSLLVSLFFSLNNLCLEFGKPCWTCLPGETGLVKPRETWGESCEKISADSSLWRLQPPMQTALMSTDESS